MKKAISTVLVIVIVMSLVFVSAYATGSPPFSKQYLSGISGVEYKRYQALEDESQQGVLLTQQSLEVYDCFDYWISNGTSWDNLIKRIQKAFEDAGFKNSTVDNGDIVLEKGDEVFVLWSEQRAYSVFNESAVVIVQHYLKKTETPTPTPTPTLTPEPTPTPTPSPTPTSSFTTVLSAQNLSVNGTAVACEKYNIDGSNYFKLRDLAALLNGTGSQFDVGWDGEKGVVSITTNHAYSTPNGTELVVGADQSATAQVSAQTIMINGTVRTDLTVYNIGGSNFFKLREMGNALGFAVDYDSTSNTAIVASKDYVASGVPEPQTQNEIFTYLKNYVINNGEKDIYDDYNYIFFTKNGEGPSSTKYPYTYHINVRLTYDSYTDELLLVRYSSTKYLKGSSYSDHRTSSVSQVTIVFPKEMTGTYSYKRQDLSGYADTTLLKETYSSSGTIDASAFNYVMETWVPNKATKVEERIPSNAFGIISDGRFVSDAMDVEYALKSLEEELLPKTPYSISDLGFMAINLSD